MEFINFIIVLTNASTNEKKITNNFASQMNEECVAHGTQSTKKKAKRLLLIAA